MNSEFAIAIRITVVIVWLCLNAWVTVRIVRDDLPSRQQRFFQTAFVWLVPIIGIILVLYIQRGEVERASGRYGEPPDPGDDFGVSARQVRRLETALEGEAPLNGATPTGE